MPTMRKKKVAGVTFPPAIMHYLDDLCAEEDLSRSQLITKIIRYYAEQHGTRISLRPDETQMQETGIKTEQETLL